MTICPYCKQDIVYPNWLERAELTPNDKRIIETISLYRPKRATTYDLIKDLGYKNEISLRSTISMVRAKMRKLGMTQTIEGDRKIGYYIGGLP